MFLFGLLQSWPVCCRLHQKLMPVETSANGPDVLCPQHRPPAARFMKQAVCGREERGWGQGHNEGLHYLAFSSSLQPQVNAMQEPGIRSSFPCVLSAFGVRADTAGC